MALHFMELLHKDNANIQHKFDLQRNTVGLEQQIYPSSEHFHNRWL